MSDAAVESSILNNIINISQKDKNQLAKAIGEYNTKNKTPLTKNQFDSPVNLKHPLMTIKGMKMAYFFDGRGQRLKYDITSEGKVSVTSITLSKDLAHQKEINSAFNDVSGDLGKISLILIIAPLA